MRNTKHLMLFSLFLSALVFVPAALSADAYNNPSNKNDYNIDKEKNKEKSRSWFGDDNDDRRLPAKDADRGDRAAELRERLYERYDNRDGYRDGRRYEGRFYDGRSYDGRSYDGRSYDGRYDNQGDLYEQDGRMGRCSEDHHYYTY